MAVKKIIYDQVFLSQKSTLANKEDLNTALDLCDTLLANRSKAVGLAANMIGQSKRIIAFYIGSLPFMMINPKIVRKSGKYMTEEGCLSLSGQRQTVRYKEITVTYQNFDFKEVTQDFSEFIAETIQHELDHCDGILI